MYVELRRELQDKVNLLPIKYAFSKSQFREAMSELGLTENDTDKIIGVGGGGFALKTEIENIRSVFNEVTTRLEEALKDDAFCIEAIEEELANHEYCITHDPSDALADLGLSAKDERVKRLFKIARQNYIKKAIENKWGDYYWGDYNNED